MSTITIQYQDELASQMPVQRGNELDHSLKVDVQVMDLKMESQAMLHWRDGDSRNRRKPIMMIPTVQDRCLSSWRPGATHEGLKHIAAFVDQHDVPTMVTGLFSLLPIPPCARWQSPPRPAPALVALASGGSIPSSCTTHTPDGMSPQIPELSPRLRASGSTNRSGKTASPCAFQQDAFQFLPMFGC